MTDLESAVFTALRPYLVDDEGYEVSVGDEPRIAVRITSDLQAKLDKAVAALVEIRDRDFGDAVYVAGLARETAAIALAEIREEGPDE